MAGGEGAKEKRRLKRMADTAVAAKNKPPAFQQRQQNNRGPPDGSKRSIDGDRPKGVSPKPHQPTFQKNQSGGAGFKTKKVSKKPKHLKRKLDQVDQGDQKTREELLDKMSTFEKIKKKTTSASAKRQKKNDEQVAKAKPEGVVEPTQEETTTEMDFIRSKPAATEMDFVRSTKPAATEIDFVRSKLAATEIDFVRSKPATKKDEPTSMPRDSSKDQVKIEHKAKSSKAQSSNDDDDDDASGDSDSDDSVEEQKKQRGKRRRGRQDTAKHVEEIIAVEKEAKEKEAIPLENLDKKGDPSKKTIKREDKRYCVGRIPVSDYVIGQSYPAKVVYVKPFGVFFDIGCHSDAFCHVSRLQDDFIDSPTSLFKEGDEVTNARVVEINQRQKRITVSLQSEARMQDELASIDARLKRTATYQKKTDKMNKKDTASRNENDKPEMTGKTNKKTAFGNDNDKPVMTGKKTAFGNETHQPARIVSTESPRNAVVSKSTPSTEQKQKHESQMTPAELKRARKLERRAVRREEQPSSSA
jgi:predicted RNA-binding protein with RPS1 domain